MASEHFKTHEQLTDQLMDLYADWETNDLLGIIREFLEDLPYDKLKARVNAEGLLSNG